MNKAMLDTDILSEISKGINPTVAARATVYRAHFGRYTFSVITVMEVIRGFQKRGSMGRLQTFRAAVALEEILSFDQVAADLAGRIVGDLERSGQPIGLADPMIAAIALRHGLELVTGNTTHFQRVADLGYALNLVNWRL